MSYPYSQKWQTNISAEIAVHCFDQRCVDDTLSVVCITFGTDS